LLELKSQADAMRKARYGHAAGAGVSVES